MVHALAAIQQAISVALEHLEPGHKVVTKGDGLSGLQVSEPRHDGVCVGVSEIGQSTQEFTLLCDQVVYGRSQIKPNVCGDLIIARASGMEFFAGIADQFDEPMLNIHMHVFELDSPLHLAVFNFPKDRVEPADDLFLFGQREYANGFEHGGMGNRASNILPVEASVKVDGGGKYLYKFVRRLTKASA